MYLELYRIVSMDPSEMQAYRSNSAPSISEMEVNMTFVKPTLLVSSILLAAVLGAPDTHPAESNLPTPIQEACRRYCGPAFDHLDEALRVAGAWFRGDATDIEPIAIGPDRACEILPGSASKTRCCPSAGMRLWIRMYGDQNPYDNPKAYYRAICR